MKRIHFRSRQYQRPSVLPDIYPVNEKIRFEQVQVIDENGQMLGAMPTSQALAIAKERGYDLIAVSPKAVPPVAKLLNYSSFKYQKEKQQKKQKKLQQTSEMKSIRLSLRIGTHDIEVRVNQAEKFLGAGDKVEIEIFLRGRERQHPDLAKEVIEKFISSVKAKSAITIEQPVKRMGAKFTAIIAPAKSS